MHVSCVEPQQVELLLPAERLIKAYARNPSADESERLPALLQFGSQIITIEPS